MLKQNIKKFFNSFSKMTLIIVGVISFILTIILAILNKEVEYIAPKFYCHKYGNFLKYYAESTTIQNIDITRISFDVVPLLFNVAVCMIVILCCVYAVQNLRRYKEMDKATKNITLRVAIFIMLVVIIILPQKLDEASILFAKNKPAIVLSTYPSMFRNGTARPKFKGNSDYYFCLNDDDEVYITLLIKNGLFNYQFTDCMATDYEINDGEVVGTEGKFGEMPSKTISKTVNGNNYKITCKRVIGINSELDKNDYNCFRYKSIIACELTGEGIDDDTDVEFIGLVTGKHYRTNMTKSIYDKKIYILPVDIDDLIELDDLTEENFDIINPMGTF
jgi:hypothetical protein